MKNEINNQEKINEWFKKQKENYKNKKIILKELYFYNNLVIGYCNESKT